MQTPHESLVLSERRGLLVAVMGNPIFYPGVVDVYDLNADCRTPALQSSLPVGLLGHESGFAPDGNTFYATSLGTGHITAVDLTDPKVPRTLAVGQYPSHGLTISDDGNRGYVAGANGLIILDTSEIQARRPNPQFQVVSRLDWPSRTIPQVAIPVTIGGRAVPGRDRRVLLAGERGQRGRQRPEGRRGAHDRHRRREGAEGRVAHPPRGPPARAPGGDRGRPRREQLAPGLRRPLLQRAAAQGPGDRRLLDDRLRPARVRHPRPVQAEGDGVLRGPEHAQQHGGAAEQLRDVGPGVRARAERGLVRRRQLRLLQRQGRRVAVRGSRGRDRRLHGGRRVPLP